MHNDSYNCDLMYNFFEYQNGKIVFWIFQTIYLHVKLGLVMTWPGFIKYLLISLKNNVTVLFVLCELIRTIDRALDVNIMPKFVRL